ncbi:MAG: 50S ribosomal protein L25/general stress protein Ctc [Oceanococcus sp.]
MEDFIVNAEPRTAQGKGASRRLRREGKVPAILYGGKGEPANLQIDGYELFHHLENEAFFSHILVVKTPAGEERAVLKDVQRHPAKPTVLHVDFLRVVAGQAIKMNVPLHFTNEGSSPATKAGGVIEHLATEVEILVLPKDLPEFIEVDLGALELDVTVHLSEIKLPKGVKLAVFEQGGDDSGIAVAHKARAVVEDEDEADSADGDAAGEEGATEE